MYLLTEFTEEERNLGLQLSGANSSNPQRQPQNSLEPHSVAANNAAFMALRANPETTIRPLNSGSGLGSPEHAGQSLGIASSSTVGATDLHSSSHDPQFSAASELINRYRLEQTINQLRGHHGFASDPRGITGLPFNQHNQV